MRSHWEVPVAPRPSAKELDSKLRQAKALLKDGQFAPCNPGKLAANFADLVLFSGEEQMEALGAAFDEVRWRDYAGERPPQQSYEDATKGCEMLAFCWDSAFFGRRMYLKFTIRAKVLFVFSLHPSRKDTRS